MLIYSNKCLEAQLEETGFTSARRKQHAAVPEIIGLTRLHRLACIVNYTHLQLLNHTFRDSCRVSKDLFRGVCTLPLPSLSCPYTSNHARLQDRAKYDTLRQREAGEPSTRYNSAACWTPEGKFPLQYFSANSVVDSPWSWSSAPPVIKDIPLVVLPLVPTLQL